MSRRSIFERVASILLVLIVWHIASMIIAQPLLLMSPVDVLQRLGTIWMEPGFWPPVIYSFTRITGGFVISFVFGIILAVLAGKFKTIEVMLWPVILAVKTVPIVAIILICLIWMTSGQLTIFIVVLMILPIIYANVLESIKSADVRMLEMAEVFQVPFGKRLLYIYLPQIKPFLISACSVSLGTSWKAGIAAEVLSVPHGSIGEMLYDSKVYFLTTDLLTWTLIVVLLSLAFEKVFLKCLELFFAWLETK